MHNSTYLLDIPYNNYLYLHLERFRVPDPASLLEVASRLTASMTISARLIATYPIPSTLPVLTSSRKPAFSATRSEIDHLISCDTVVACVRGKRIRHLELLVAPDFAWVPRIQSPSLSREAAASIETIKRHRLRPRIAAFVADHLPWRNCYPSYPIPDYRTVAILT
jgi:hypothetical protein